MYTNMFLSINYKLKNLLLYINIIIRIKTQKYDYLKCFHNPLGT